ncbi:hypothetical protein ROHU_016147 [Labeo rohita]|uniref:Uncharacterized protein n=1 Tax=Labeo rohita TaxID=84645 RepID=A0A498NL26_LABRO|nr:hypothetical protein ROHU_016147 [Labeo rohita]
MILSESLSERPVRYYCAPVRSNVCKQTLSDSSDTDIPPEHSKPPDKSIHELRMLCCSSHVPHADLWECVIPAEAPLRCGFRNDLQTRFPQIHQTRTETPSPFICCS